LAIDRLLSPIARRPSPVTHCPSPVAHRLSAITAPSSSLLLAADDDASHEESAVEMKLPLRDTDRERDPLLSRRAGGCPAEPETSQLLDCSHHCRHCWCTAMAVGPHPSPIAYQPLPLPSPSPVAHRPASPLLVTCTTVVFATK